MKASSKAEAINIELGAARAKLSSFQQERDASSGRRVALENERAALVIPAREGDAEKAKRLKIIKREIAEAVEAEGELADAIQQQGERVAALEAAVRQAERSALRTKRANDIDGRLREQAAQIDEALGVLITAIAGHAETLNERNAISLQLGDCRPLTPRNATRTITAIVGDLGIFGAVRLGRPFRGRYSDVLKQMLSGTQSADDDVQDLAVNA